MSTNFHTPIVAGESNSPSTVNTRFSDLDTGIQAAYDRAGDIIADSGTSSTEVVDARGAGNTDGASVTVLRDRIEYAAGDMYNVNAYGATGDGVTDDLTAIQAAIDAANAAGGGLVFFPRGTYIVSDYVVPKSNVVLQGVHGKTTIRAERATQGRMVRTTAACDNFALVDMRFDRSHANTDHGVELRGGDNLYIKGCIFYGESGVGGGAGSLTISAYSASAIATTTNVRIVDCFFQEAGNYGVQMGDVSDVVVTNNVFLDCYREVVGVEPQTGQTASNVSITGNVVTFTTNTVTNGTATGAIVVTQNATGVVENITIRGNTIREVGSPSNGHYGINVSGGSNVAVTSNVILGTKEYGIFLLASGTTENIAVIGNTVRDCNAAGAGILISNISLAIIANNIVTGSTTGIQNITGTPLLSDNIISATTPVTSTTGTAFRRGNYAERTAYRNDMMIHGSQIAKYVSKSVTGANTPIFALSNWREVTTNYCGLIHVIARSGSGDSGDVATYLLHLINTGAGDACQLIDARGEITGSGSSWPSFTWTLDSGNHHLEATPISATTGTFHFYATVIGDMSLAEA